jgi:hypothetical protein
LRHREQYPQGSFPEVREEAERRSSAGARASAVARPSLASSPERETSDLEAESREGECPREVNTQESQGPVCG